MKEKKTARKEKPNPAVMSPAKEVKTADGQPGQSEAHPDETPEDICLLEESYRKEKLRKLAQLPAIQKEADSALADFENTARLLFKCSNYAPETLDPIRLAKVMDLCLQMFRKLIKPRSGETAIVPLLKSMNYGCDVLAEVATKGKSESVRLAAAEQLLGITGDCLHFMEQVTAKGILDERIKYAVAWPVMVGLQTKDPRYHKTVVAALNQKCLGSLAPTGINNRSGGKKDSVARAWATHINGVIITIRGLDERPSEKQNHHLESPHSWDTSRILGDMRYSVDLIQSFRPDLVPLIKSQSSFVPTDQLWKAVAQKILFVFRSELRSPEKLGRPEKGNPPVDPSARRKRADIRQAYLGLANVPNKSHDIPGKYGDSKKKK